jgi:hypothetical protein
MWQLPDEIEEHLARLRHGELMILNLYRLECLMVRSSRIFKGLYLASPKMEKALIGWRSVV